MEWSLFLESEETIHSAGINDTSYELSSCFSLGKKFEKKKMKKKNWMFCFLLMKILKAFIWSSFRLCFLRHISSGHREAACVKMHVEHAYMTFGWQNKIVWDQHSTWWSQNPPSPILKIQT